ncbi:DUF533 domain-containing protein [Klebsiella aerogenes]|nr:DUF533 domain-containing protein [Klebsiella aerogenes]
MANWLNQLQTLLGQQGSSASSEKSSSGKNLLLPGALGGLAGLLVASKSSRKLLAKYGAGALLVGGGAVAGSVLWNKYQQKMRGQQTGASPEGERVPEPVALDARSERLITALVFAAKSDGHIDERERQHIEEQLRAADIDVQGRVLIDRVLTQPLDPQRLAQSVRDGQEALEIYYLSCAVIDIDHFMERSYLDALGEALKLPQDVREEMERDIQAQKQALTA